MWNIANGEKFIKIHKANSILENSISSKNFTQIYLKSCVSNAFRELFLLYMKRIYGVQNRQLKPNISRLQFHINLSYLYDEIHPKKKNKQTDIDQISLKPENIGATLPIVCLIIGEINFRINIPFLAIRFFFSTVLVYTLQSSQFYHFYSVLMMENLRTIFALIITIIIFM